MQDKNIIILSNDKEKAEIIASKILLLRTVDSIGMYNLVEATNKLKSQNPDLIIFITSKPEDIETIKKLKENKANNFAPIIYVTNKIDQDILCKAYDYGISDYFTIDTDDTQILIKIMWGIQKKQLLNEAYKKNNILISLGVLDNESKFYTKQNTEQSFKAEFESIIESSKDAIFMIISADVACKNILSQTFLASILKKEMRQTDIIGFAPDNKFYLILNDTNENGARTIYNKLNDSLLDAYSISAAAIRIADTDFTATERLVNKALTEALILKKKLIFADENIKKKDIGWIDKSDLKDQNFKMFKETFMKKIEKIITPAFFQMQTVLQEKLFETEIKQYINENESLFSLEKQDYKMHIKIKYPGYSKINIDIVENYPDDKKTERITLEPYELTPARLDEILQISVTKFQQKIIYLN